MNHPPRQDDASAETLLGRAADEFTRRVELGERPDVEEYADRYPQVAAVIRDVFPALLALRAIPGDVVSPHESSFEPRAPLGQLGDYRLIREVGRGGMGIVYEAEEISLGRHVALKVLPFAAVLDERQLLRFKREAKAAAQLHHSNIVPLFAVGCERGVHYHAMQYIEGWPLSVVIEELAKRRRAHGSAAPAPRDNQSDNASSAARHVGLPATAVQTLSSFHDDWSRAFAAADATENSAYFTAIARLGVQAAEALQHAHTHGVIHRDIKPANLLLDASGNAWLTDFGLARLATGSDLTLSGDVLGTLRYMSPEQALPCGAPVDARTDIYSLGMTLYELLCLEPAFDGRTRPELLRQIERHEPRPLRRVCIAIPRELETIVRKAIDEDSTARYATAQELADDLRRFLEHRPVLAKPPTLGDRTTKWARRHRTIVTAGAVMLCLAVAVLSVSTVLISRERAAAVRQQHIAQKQRETAEQNLKVAREAVHQLLTRDRRDAFEGPRLPHDALLRDALNLPLESLQAKSNVTAVRHEVAWAYGRVGHSSVLLGQDSRAEAAYREAIEIYEELESQDTLSSDACREFVDCRASLATLLWSRERTSEAADTAWTACEQIQDPRYLATESLERRETGARLLNLLGVILHEAGRRDRAELAFRQSADLWKTLRAESPENPRPRQELARVLANYADILTTTGRRATAEQTVARVLDLQKGLVEEFPAEPGYSDDLAGTQRWWSDVLRGVTASPATRPTALAASDLRNIITQVAGEIPWYAERLARGYQDLDLTLYRVGQIDEAQAAAEMACDLLTKLIREFPAEPKYRAELADLLTRQARMMMLTWQLGAADEMFKRAEDVLRQLVTDFPEQDIHRRRRAEVRGALACLRARQYVGELVNNGKESPEGVGRAVKIAAATDIEGARLSPFTLLIHGEYLLLGGEYERSADVIRRAIDKSGNRVEDYYHKSLGCALLACGRAEAAREAFLSALGNYRDLPRLPASACPDYWTAAYFLDRITAREYAAHHADMLWTGWVMAPFPWFYIGLRAELEGRTEKATECYQRCMEYQNLPNAHHTVYWAIYRLQRLRENRGLADAVSATIAPPEVTSESNRESEE